MHATVLLSCLSGIIAASPAASPGGASDAGVTVVEGSDAGDDDGADRVRLDRVPGASPEEALEALGGLTLLRSGGPLAPVRPEVRGLTGPRLDVSLDGLPLASPASGDVDVGLVPWVALAAAELDAGAAPGTGPEGGGALGGVLRLESLEPLWPRGRARVGVGTLGTYDVGIAGGLPLDDDVLMSRGAVFAAISAARTSGDFLFQPTSPTGAVRDPTLRLNNDQARASAFASVRAAALGWQARATALVGLREGGIPGFASAPTDGVRGRRALIASGLVVKHPVDSALGRMTLDLFGDVRADHRATRTASVSSWDAVNATALRAGAGFEIARLPTGLSLSAAAHGESAQILGHLFRRRGGGLRSGLSWAPFSFLLVEGGAEVRWLSDVGPLVSASSSVAVGPRWLRGGLRIAHAVRPPTLDELYAPSGLVLGNPDLAPESATEGEVSVRSGIGRFFELHATGFAGRVHEAILLLNRNAFEIAPANTGGIWRGGLEGGGGWRPHPLLGLALSGRVLASRLDVSGAPMPVAPGVGGRGSVRLGARGGGHVVFAVRHRGATTSNLYGTLEVPGYVLADVVGRLPLGRHLRLEASVTNVFNTLTARDLNGLPLPGRQLFASVEATL